MPTSRDLAAYLLESVDVAVAPGEDFGAPGWLQLDFAQDDKLLEAAAGRIVEACNALGGASRPE